MYEWGRTRILYEALQFSLLGTTRHSCSCEYHTIRDRLVTICTLESDQRMNYPSTGYPSTKSLVQPTASYPSIAPIHPASSPTQMSCLICKPLATPINISPTISPPVIQSQKYASGRHEQKQCCVGPVARWVSFLGFVAFVDPDSDNLTWRAE